MNRALNQATPTKHLRITYDLYIYGMKMFPVDIQIHHVMALLYHCVCSYCMLACIVGKWYTCWDADNSVTLYWHGSAQSQSVGQLPLECPGCLNPSVHITCGTSSAWLLAVLRSNAGCSSAHSSRRIALKTTDETVVIMCQQILCLLTQAFFQLHHLQCLPIPLKQPLFLMVCIATLCACFYIHSCNCRHMCVLIVHVSQMCTSLSLRTNCVHIYLL